MNSQIIIAAAAAGVIASAARAAIVVTSVSGFAHAEGYTVAPGFDRDEFNLTQTIAALGESASFTEDSSAGGSVANAAASCATQLIPDGFRAFSGDSASAHIGVAGGNAVASSRSDITVRFLVTSTDPVNFEGTFSGDMSFPGGRSYFGDGVMTVYNPSGAVVFRRNYHGTGSRVQEQIASPDLGEWRIEFSSLGSATDFGGGGFSGGSATGSLNIAITSIPAPGPAGLAAAMVVTAGLRRLRPTPARPAGPSVRRASPMTGR